MKDLIKEIEGLKLETHPEETEYRFGFRDGNNMCVVSVKNILTQHNIITAPKSVKLSEILSRLNEEYKEKPIFQRWTKNYKTIHLENRGGMLELSNNKIHEIYLFRLTSKTRWIYTLWIAETEIIDDLEEKE